MRVWVSRSEAKKIRWWAIGENEEGLADRFYRAERKASNRMPFLARLRARRPVFVRCQYCQQWEGFARHRDAIKDGWVYLGWNDIRSIDDGWRLQGWVHGRCVEVWKEQGVELSELRARAKKQQSQLDFLFGQRSLLDTYNDVLVRSSP